MRRIDSKHIAFHVLVALYFIWIIVFSVLMGMALTNTYGEMPNPYLTNVFVQWIYLNLLMGSALYISIRLFRNRTLLDKIILVSFILEIIAAVIVVMLIGN
ncbi:MULTISPECIES: hypothetical protein [Flavobacterium]|uniref:Uncharacterized protein n=1 Tax=Flavobacterium suzhouense TaxID=1529638 RepID=A0ABW5NQ00_9FLAO|nr:hypothetical protein [Flavobacterium sp. AG291]RDI06950.1 hypothetical protein DEU42_11349 [Flavobacterium sp. AG291]